MGGFLLSCFLILLLFFVLAFSSRSGQAIVRGLRWRGWFWRNRVVRNVRDLHLLVRRRYSVCPALCCDPDIEREVCFGLYADWYGLGLWGLCGDVCHCGCGFVFFWQGAPDGDGLLHGTVSGFLGLFFRFGFVGVGIRHCGCCK